MSIKNATTTSYSFINPMSKKLIFTTVILLILALIGAFFYSTYQNNEFQRVTGINPQTITPQFVDDQEYMNIPLPEDWKRIKEFVGNKLQSNIVLRAVTPENVLVGVMGPIAMDGCLFNLKKNLGSNKYEYQCVDAPDNLASDVIFYVENQKVFYYKLGQKEIIAIPQSQLDPYETYMATIGTLYDLPNVTSKTSATLTLSVYSVQNMVWDRVTGDYTGQQKLRDVTFTIK